jgi:hypothetical protein
VSADTDALKRKWQQLFQSSLPGYISLRSSHLVALGVFIFIKESLVNHVRNVEVCMKKTGFGGMAGNKGGIGVSLNIHDTKMLFISAHLAAGNRDWKLIFFRSEQYGRP